MPDTCTYASHDGVALMADLYAPTGAGPFPALVAVHGGGWQAGARSTFQYWGPYLAERGYVLFAISYRLAKKGQKMFPQAVQDVLAAVQFVRASAQTLKIEPERIGLFGASAGAHLAALAALAGERFKQGYLNDEHASASTRVKALVGVYGVYDLVEMWQRYQLQSPRERLGSRRYSADLSPRSTRSDAGERTSAINTGVVAVKSLEFSPAESTITSGNRIDSGAKLTPNSSRTAHLFGSIRMSNAFARR